MEKENIMPTTADAATQRQDSEKYMSRLCITVPTEMEKVLRDESKPKGESISGLIQHRLAAYDAIIRDGLLTLRRRFSQQDLVFMIKTLGDIKMQPSTAPLQHLSIKAKILETVPNENRDTVGTEIDALSQVESLAVAEVATRCRGRAEILQNIMERFGFEDEYE